MFESGNSDYIITATDLDIALRKGRLGRKERVAQAEYRRIINSFVGYDDAPDVSHMLSCIVACGFQFTWSTHGVVLPVRDGVLLGEFCAEDGRIAAYTEACGIEILGELRDVGRIDWQDGVVCPFIPSRRERDRAWSRLLKGDE